MGKDFDSWNREKKIVDQKVVSRDLFFHTREIWWCSAGLNVGVEADGKNENFERPFLIIKKFNADMIWGLPLTSKEKYDRFHYKLDFEHLRSCVILTQIKTISTKRLVRKIWLMPEAEFGKIIRRVKNILESP